MVFRTLSLVFSVKLGFPCSRMYGPKQKSTLAESAFSNIPSWWAICKNHCNPLVLDKACDMPWTRVASCYLNFILPKKKRVKNKRNKQEKFVFLIFSIYHANVIILFFVV